MQNTMAHSKKKKNNVPKINQKLKPGKPSVRMNSSLNPERYNSETPVWSIKCVDSDSRWAFQCLTLDCFMKEVFLKLQDFETMTWQEILKASGGKKHGNNSHNVSVANICKDAQKRLREIGMNDIDELFSLRLAAKKRVWGVRNGRALEIIWYDDNHEICPSLR